MAYTGSGSNSSEYGGLRAEGREPGARRKKLAGYLKAANELRQSYFNADHRDGMGHGAEDGPDAFPHAAVARSGNEEMILFPSYAKTHVKGQIDRPPSLGTDLTEEEYWRREWTKHEDSNAVVDVDVRGWIYTPQSGQTTRKQRLMIGLARQLSGLPSSTTGRPEESAPSSTVPSRSTSPTRAQDEDLINLEAEKIVRNGQREEQYASRGAFSERPGSNWYANEAREYLSNDIPGSRSRQGQQNASTAPSQDEAPLPSHRKRSSWAAPAQMSAAELDIANKHLFARLRPFMSSPIMNTPISAFFYNDSASRQQTVYTDTSGHFSVRAALDFIPTHVRVLVGEKLSATEEVIVTPERGVSLISDIDDTIKHSAITAGAREIFRTAFIRELGDLTIEGVREWYTRMHDLGVKLHYVSNSPWQMYPILTTYFKMAHLPKGSFHLKQYTGMLQGIFEPVAERKKSNLERIMRDFPDRKFILVGDSGEADLEVYTDVALDHPGKILGIFIRDVTTTTKTGYFNPNHSPSGSTTPRSGQPSNRSRESLAQSKRLTRPDDIRNDDADLEAAIAASLQDMEAEARRARRSINPDAPDSERLQPENTRPRLPPRPPAHPVTSRLSEKSIPMTASPEEDLINFTDPMPKPWLASSARRNSNPSGKSSQLSPAPPPKPSNLRGSSPNSEQTMSRENGAKSAPPIPRKPSSAVKANAEPSHPTTRQAHAPSPLSANLPDASQVKTSPPPLPERRRVQRESNTQPTSSQIPSRQSEARSGGYQPRSSGGSQVYGQQSSPLAFSVKTAKSFDDFNLPASALPKPAAPPPPPRRTYASSTTSSLREDRRSSSWDDQELAGLSGEALSKKEYLWRQRWANAKDVLERKGVTLRTWRVGSDVADVCAKLVEMAMRDMEREKKNKKTQQAER